MFDLTSLCVGAVFGALLITVVLFVAALLDDTLNRKNHNPFKEP